MLDMEQKVDRLEDAMLRTHLMLQGLSMEVSKTQQEIRDFKLHTQTAIDKLNKDINSNWEKMTKKMGTLVEDMVVPNIKFIAHKYFNCKDCIDFSIRRYKVKPDKSGKGREFDVIALYPDKVIVNESKSNPCDIDDIRKYIKAVKEEFFEYFPEYQNKEVIAIFSSYYIPDHIKTFLTDRRIYAMGMKEDTMDILNFNDIK